MGVLVDGIRDIARMQTMGTVIGPVSIGNNAILAQNIVLSELNHGYTDPAKILKQYHPLTKTLEKP